MFDVGPELEVLFLDEDVTVFCDMELLSEANPLFDVDFPVEPGV